MADKVQRYSYSSQGMTQSARGAYVYYSDYVKLGSELREAKRFMSRIIPCELTVDGYSGDLGECIELYNFAVMQLRATCEMLDDAESLHADIIAQGRKVQIAASGESKYGEFIEWALGKLEGK